MKRLRSKAVDSNLREDRREHWQKYRDRLNGGFVFRIKRSDRIKDWLELLYNRSVGVNSKSDKNRDTDWLVKKGLAKYYRSVDIFGHGRRSLTILMITEAGRTYYESMLKPVSEERHGFISAEKARWKKQPYAARSESERRAIDEFQDVA